MVFGCILENTIKNTFFTYCLHFLTFSQLSNKYIISFLNTETQKKQNLEKKIHQIRLYRNTKETNPKKKNSSDRATEERLSGIGVNLCLIGMVRSALESIFA